MHLICYNHHIYLPSGGSGREDKQDGKCRLCSLDDDVGGPTTNAKTKQSKARTNKIKSNVRNISQNYHANGEQRRQTLILLHIYLWASVSYTDLMNCLFHLLNLTRATATLVAREKKSNRLAARENKKEITSLFKQKGNKKRIYKFIYFILLMIPDAVIIVNTLWIQKYCSSFPFDYFFLLPSFFAYRHE